MASFNLLHQWLSLQGVIQSPRKSKLCNGVSVSQQVPGGFGGEVCSPHPQPPEQIQKQGLLSNRALIYKPRSRSWPAAGTAPPHPVPTPARLKLGKNGDLLEG